ncbi:MAG: glycosyltransferase family 9 protein [Nitrospirales bacterium]|nr:glycosyltransferase family 9 protein [Nitrospirales bacterium]
MTPSLMKPKLVVLHPGALGDGLLSLPTIRGLRRQYPRHKLIWIGHKALGEVFVKAGEVHETFSFDAFQVWDILRPNSPIHQSLQACDSAIDLMVGWMNDDNGYWKAWAEKLGYACSIFRSPRDRQLTSRHMMERYWEVLVEESQAWCPLLLQEDFRTLKGTFKKFKAALGHPLRKSPATRIEILLHPGSGSPYKCAGPDIFSRLAKKLITRFPQRVALIGGPADTKYLNPILTTLTDIDPPCFQNLDLLTICEFFQQVNLFIGHDSGLSHMAANLGVPSLLLFGPTDPAVWAPRGAHILVRRDQNLHFSPDDLCHSAEQLLQDCQKLLIA